MGKHCKRKRMDFGSGIQLGSTPPTTPSNHLHSSHSFFLSPRLQVALNNLFFLLLNINLHHFLGKQALDQARMPPIGRCSCFLQFFYKLLLLLLPPPPMPLIPPLSRILLSPFIRQPFPPSPNPPRRVFAFDSSDLR